MTAQISDGVLHRGKRNSLVGINGSGLFDPAQQGIQVAAISTASWRGFHCTYEVADKALYLTQVNLGLRHEDFDHAKRGEGPLLFGKVPHTYTCYGSGIDLHTRETFTSWESSDFMVEGLHELVPFSGGLLLGDNFIRALYVHMGFQSVYKFRNVYELVFEAGQLLEEYDRSKQVAKIREMMSSRPLRPGPNASWGELEEWVKQSFSLEYKDLLP